MNRSHTFTVALFSLIMCFSMQVQAQKFAPLDKSPMDAAAFPTSYKEANKLIKIVYSRPQLKGRSLDKLAPKGKVWRVGANEAAELTLYTDMKLDGKTIPAGTYTFYLIPGDSEWTAIVNTDLNVWGSYFYKEENDVARITIPLSKVEESLEAFSIAFDDSSNGVDMFLGWGNLRAKVPFTK